MKKLMTVLVAALALVLVAFTPDLASAGHGHGGGHGWHGGGHWHGGGGHWRGGHAWRGGRGWHGGWHGHRGWYGYRGWRGYGWGGWWGPGINIYVGGYGRRCWSPAYGYYPCRYRYGWGY